MDEDDDDDDEDDLEGEYPDELLLLCTVVPLLLDGVPVLLGLT